MRAFHKRGIYMLTPTGPNDAHKAAKKAWIAPTAVAEKVRDITEGSPTNHNTADGSCSS